MRFVHHLTATCTHHPYPITHNSTPSGPLRAAVIDQPKGFGYFATYAVPSKIIKVNLGTGNNLPTRASALTLNSGENYVSAGR